jgi:hypothetical protein
MSPPRQFLLCDDEIHAAVVDQFIAEKLRIDEGSLCSSWSGVWTDGVRFGVVWANPASALFGASESDPAIVIADEVLTDGESDWSLMVEPENTEEL